MIVRTGFTAYGRAVRWMTFQVLCWLLAAFTVRAESAWILKVLPCYLDQKGRHALHPSLYERDAYQAHLRKHPELCKALRFDVQWKGSGLKEAVLRVEARGNLKGQLQQAVLEGKATKGWLGNWSALNLEGEAYRNLGELTAWRVTLWSGGRQVAEQKSFLW
jgi:hypothetical protein